MSAHYVLSACKCRQALYTQTRTHAQGPCCDHCGNLHKNKSFVSLAVTVAMFMSLRYVNYNNTSVMLGRYKVWGSPCYPAGGFPITPLIPPLFPRKRVPYSPGYFPLLACLHGGIGNPFAGE